MSTALTLQTTLELKENDFIVFKPDIYEFADATTYETQTGVLQIDVNVTNFQVLLNHSATKRLFLRTDRALTAKIVLAGSNLGATESINLVPNFPYALADSVGFEGIYISNASLTLTARLTFCCIGDDT